MFGTYGESSRGRQLGSLQKLFPLEKVGVTHDSGTRTLTLQLRSVSPTERKRVDETKREKGSVRDKSRPRRTLQDFPSPNRELVVSLTLNLN